jgi:XTP/dITP diphosphohydrolase
LPQLLIATNNRGKLAEYHVLLKGCGWQLVSPAEIGLRLSVDETGNDYATNARIKAEAFARASGLLTLADDSGLEVDALGGRPGPLSARYAARTRRTSRASISFSRDEGRRAGASRARFRCVIALRSRMATCAPSKAVSGRHHNEPRGHNGFGRPVFYLPPSAAPWRS